MSHALLKRSLQLLDDDLTFSNNVSKNKKPKATKDEHKNKSKTILDLIPENQRMTSYTRDGMYKKKKKINLIKTEEKFTVKQAQNKMKRNRDKTEENVQRLLQLNHSHKLNDETTELLVKRAQTGHYVIPEQKPKEEEESVFTAEDFAKFEREYFVS